MTKKITILTLILIVVLGGFVRFVGIGQTPAGLNVDEIAIGYDAFSILKTGHDMHDIYLPISFRSLGDYKAPFYIYLTSISIYLFGLNEFAVRFMSAFFGTLAIVATFFLAHLIFKDYKLSLLGALFLAISPWHVFYSRIVSEAQVAACFVIIGIAALIKLREERFAWGIVSTLFLSISMYTYHSEKIFVPLFLLTWSFYNKEWLKLHKTKHLYLLIFAFILLLPLIIDYFLGQGSTRATQQSIFSDSNFIRQVAVSQIGNTNIWFNEIYRFLNDDWILVVFFSIRKYLSFLQPDFLYLNALPMVKLGQNGLGVMYMFQMPAFIFGIYRILKIKTENRYILLLWVLVGFLPAAITLAEHHAVRTLVIVPIFSIISAIGLFGIIELISKYKNKPVTFLIISVFLGFMLLNFLQAYLMFKVHFPTQQADTFMVGNKEAIEWIINNEDSYYEIVFDPKRFVDGETIVGVPHLYYLFYKAYSPSTLQKEITDPNRVDSKVGKLMVRDINWAVDRQQKKILFVGNPEVMPEKDLQESIVHKKILLPDGKVTLLIVSVGK